MRLFRGAQLIIQISTPESVKRDNKIEAHNFALTSRHSMPTHPFMPLLASLIFLEEPPVKDDPLKIHLWQFARVRDSAKIRLRLNFDALLQQQQLVRATT